MYTWLVTEADGFINYVCIVYCDRSQLNPFYSSDIVFIILSFSIAVASGNKNNITLVSGVNYICDWILEN